MTRDRERAFDPNAASQPGSGLFGLPHTPAEAQVHVQAVPFDATTSYRQGAAHGPEAVLAASHQVDLFDLDHGRPWEVGICLLEPDPRLEELQREASTLARPIIDRGGDIAGDAALETARTRVNAIGAELNAIVHERTHVILEAGRLPCVLGGDHAVPFGAIEACAERHPGMGILHFDAHADLRVAYEGFTWSHASILGNVLERIPSVAKVLQVGLRDVGEDELERIQGAGGRVHACFDRDWAHARLERRNLRALVRQHLAELPREVYLTFDIDGLDPTLCPNTGTPVPGGLRWDETLLWLEELAHSGRRIIGLDLVEISPGATPDPEGRSWDAIVGARLLYKLIGCALATR
jgi:agmatinase